MPVDINCDMGEGMSNDEQIMPFITSANIACGYHAGDISTMQKTIELCLKHNVAIGAHPSFHDRNNFGRITAQHSPEEVYELIIQQLFILAEVANAFNTKLHHVKPHGALYNKAAKDSSIALAIAKAVKAFDNQLILYGLSGSESIIQAQATGIKTASEVFADRSYQDDGTLTPRSMPNALIEDIDKATIQVLQMVREGMVTTVNGLSVPVITETICIHGDGKYAVELAKSVHKFINTA
jgi:UPF0271 protein